MTELRSIGETAVDLAESGGADEAEAVLVSRRMSRASFHAQLDGGSSSTLRGLGLRVNLDGRLGFYSTTSLEDEAVARAVERAVAIAEASPREEEWDSFPTRYGEASVSGIYDGETASLTAEDMVETAALVIESVEDLDPDAKVTRGFVGTVDSEFAVANSYGCDLSRRETAASLWVRVKKEESGETGSSDESAAKRRWRDIEFEELAEEAARRAGQMVEARPVSSGRLNVVWRNKIFSNLLSIMFSGPLSADAVQEGRSPYKGRVGDQVAAGSFELVDDALAEGRVGTVPFDDEGVEPTRVSLVEGGVLQGFLYDNYTAKKDGRESTGNAKRGGALFGSPKQWQNVPSPGPHNLTLIEGDASFEELVEEANHGLLVEDTIGEWMSNPVSGELSATVTNGFLIEGAEVGRPVKGVVVSAEFDSLIGGSLEGIGKDAVTYGSNRSPSVLTSDVTVAGG